MPEISSFVFIDLETTGLPWQERNQTKIIEISLIAVLREHLEDADFGEIPLASKLSIILNPKRPIQSAAVQLTGLSNELLRNAATFKQKFKTLNSFLKYLPKPVCLIAHNGYRFDFKILLAECCDANASLPEDLFCADSLACFKEILKGKNICYETLKPQVEDLSNFLTDDEEDWPEINASKEDWDEIDSLCSSLSEMSSLSEAELEVKPVKAKTAKAKPVKVKATEKEKFTLICVYKRLLNKEIDNAHRAEADCIALAECAVAVKDEFMQWVDNNCKLLTDIEPLQRCYSGSYQKSRQTETSNSRILS